MKLQTDFSNTLQDPLFKILKETDSMIERWSKERADNEEFGDFVIRAGVVKEIKSSATDFWD